MTKCATFVSVSQFETSACFILKPLPYDKRIENPVHREKKKKQKKQKKTRHNIFQEDVVAESVETAGQK
jgi:hypothetical protein